MFTPPTRRLLARALVALVSMGVIGRSLLAQTAEGDPRSGPWDLNLVLLKSADGLRWQEKGLFIERAGVPTVIQNRQGRIFVLFQWFPEGNVEAFDRIACASSSDQGETWSAPESIVVEGMPRTLRRPFDPTLVELENGRYRLYFTSHEVKAAGELRIQDAIWPGIHSAVSEDCLQFKYEPGVRFAIDSEMVIDGAAVYWNGEWHLFAPIQGTPGGAYHATSKDGLTFERQPDLHLDTRGSWLGCVVPIPSGLRFYGSGRGGWCADSLDAKSWRLLADTLRPTGMDPGVVRLKDESWMMVATGEMRPEARERVGLRARDRSARDEEPREPGIRSPLARTEPAAITANDKFVYVLRHGMLHKLDAESLVILKSVRLPDEVSGPAEGVPSPPPNGERK